MDRLWFTPAPAERLAAVRVFVGAFTLVFLLVRGVNLASYGRLPAHRFDPVGVVTILDAALPNVVVMGLVIATILTAIPFMLGWKFKVFGPLFALLLLWTVTYRQCWGMIFHTENVMVLHVMILAMTASTDAYALDESARDDGPHLRYGWPLKLMAALVVVSYVIAGIAKLRVTGWEWMDGEVLRVQIAYDNVRKIELNAIHAPLGAWLVQFGWIFPALGFTSLILELGAPMALLGRRLAWIWAIAVWGFHLGVLLLMAIFFAYPLSFCAFAPLFKAEHAYEAVRSRWAQWRA